MNVDISRLRNSALNERKKEESKEARDEEEMLSVHQSGIRRSAEENGIASVEKLSVNLQQTLAGFQSDTEICRCVLKRLIRHLIRIDSFRPSLTLKTQCRIDTNQGRFDRQIGFNRTEAQLGSQLASCNLTQAYLT